MTVTEAEKERKKRKEINTERYREATEKKIARGNIFISRNK